MQCGREHSILPRCCSANESTTPRAENGRLSPTPALVDAMVGCQSRYVIGSDCSTFLNESSVGIIGVKLGAKVLVWATLLPFADLLPVHNPLRFISIEW